MKIVITGGHFSPALAVIENLPKDAQVFFVGRKSSFEGDNSPTLEYQTIKSLNIPFVNLPNARFQRKFTTHTISSLLKFPYAILIATACLRKIKPDVILGFGGYISFSVGVAALILRIPVVIHEQTQEAGASNKIVSLWAKKVCISWESSNKFFPKRKTVLTGNPIRKEILESKVESQKSNVPTIFITGGSSGSHFINDLVGKCLVELLKKYKVIHQTGDSQEYRDFEKLTEIKSKLPEDLSRNYALMKFIEPSDFGLILRSSTLAVGRAGINTVTEILYLQKPAILIPLPFSQKNEQLKNATFVQNLGLAQVLEQDKMSEELFISKINYMIKNIGTYKIHAREELIDEDAPKNIISIVYGASKTK